MLCFLNVHVCSIGIVSQLFSIPFFENITVFNCHGANKYENKFTKNEIVAYLLFTFGFRYPQKYDIARSLLQTEDIHLFNLCLHLSSVSLSTLFFSFHEFSLMKNQKYGPILKWLDVELSGLANEVYLQMKYVISHQSMSKNTLTYLNHRMKHETLVSQTVLIS